MSPFSPSLVFECILVVVDYGSKWVKVISTRINDAYYIFKCLKDIIFSNFGKLMSIISDGGRHFCNKLFERLLKKFNITKKIAISYHPQTSNQVEVSNIKIKVILKKDSMALKEGLHSQTK